MSTIEDNSDHRLGVRLRAERVKRGQSLRDLAAASGVSRAMIQKIEAAKASPSAQILGRLSGALGLTISELLNLSENGDGCLATGADQPVWRDPETGYQRTRLTPAGAASRIELIESTLPPGARIAYPAAAYVFLDQQILGLEGRLTFQQGARLHEIGPGDCLVLGAPAATVFANETGEPCRYLVAITRS